ncbi:uncharacterized protein DUF4132 [Planomicrobium soli]|uniref:Uncharacterized protein DUF4132 n=1 Tax=Planomicrobium soli TaxID=1176648 RepID=A0A2P8H3X8_9BACL|nr:DUF4132 domain-containing protein [Planomicrobium soli]PSL40900.1 uncharacterized protein DUF4132 [Planomicrobium soli]
MTPKIDEQYLKDRKEKVNRLPEADKALGQKLARAATLEDYHYDSHIRRLKRELERDAPSFDEKIHKLKLLTEQLLPSYYAKVLAYIIEHSTEYAYTSGYDRRPFRTPEPSAHLDLILWKCVGLHAFASSQLSFSELLTRKSNYAEYSVASDIFAYEIDRQNDEVLELIRDAVFGDNNYALLSRDLIKGMVLSHDREMYTMLGQLLVAARLQEGLRQSIVETMDEGCLDATIYLMHVIIEHDLIRYSSVARAMSVWTGIELEVENKRVLKQIIHYMHEALTDESCRTEWLTSENADKLYISIWATAVRNELQLKSAVAKVMNSGAPYQKVAALHLLMESENLYVKYVIAADNLGVSSTEIEAMIIANYPDTYDYKAIHKIHSNGGSNKDESNYIPELGDEIERNRQFLKLMEMFQVAPQKELIISSKLFNGAEIRYSNESVAKKILYLISYDYDSQKLKALLVYKALLGTDTRGIILNNFMHNFDDPVLRDFVFSSLSDRSSYNRELALKKISQMTLNSDEVLRVEALLKLKTGTVRQAAIKLLMKLDQPMLKSSISRLVSSRNELLRLGALELLTVIKDKKPKQYSFFQNIHLAVEHPTPKEQILLDKLTVQEEDGAQAGFGLYDTNRTFQLLEEQPAIEPLLLHDFFNLKLDRFKEMLSDLDQLVHQHRNASYEIEDYGSTETYLIGAEINRDNSYYSENQPKGIRTLPITEVWVDFFKEKKVTPMELFQLETVFSLQIAYGYYLKLCQIESAGSTPSSKWRKDLFESLYPVETLAGFYDSYQSMRYKQQLREIVAAFFEDRNKQAFFKMTSQILDSFIKGIPEDVRKEQSGLFEYLAHPWLDWLSEDSEEKLDDDSFKHYFKLKYQLYTAKNFRKYHPTTEEINRAYGLGLLDRNECFKELLDRSGGEYGHHLYHLTHPGSSGKFKALEKLKEEIVERLLEIELKRGDLPTPASKLAVEIDHFEGAEYFFSILKALDGETFPRGYFYSFDNQYSKKDVLSQLLKNCYPCKDDNGKRLALLFEEFSIPDKRLLEAAMYAPQWTDIISAHLGWGGLKKAIWYFHAHTSESLSSEKETVIAQYSPISPEGFNDGAFDIGWFKEAYEELGKERFDLLYACAKYISSGALHRRAQLFADAAMGNLDIEELKTSIQTKRNKEHLLAYSLLPIIAKFEETILDRYDFIQQFLTESKQFGAQRRASEAKVVEIALKNLALAGGYEDLTRMRWSLEGKKMETIQQYTVSAEVEGYQAHIEIDNSGKSRLRVFKGEKELASLPAKLKKNDYVITLKEIHSKLKEQYSRNRAELEKSMVLQSPFRKRELEQMLNNPVVAPLAKKLVFKIDERFGFLEENGLVQENGDIYPFQETDVATIAHCVHLQENGIWAAYQRILYDQKVIQPFKQVFRELYVLNEDEKLDGYRSLRYAGHQLQPAKAITLFRGRSWTVHYEEGLQKVYHQENIIATVDALADWYSPADIESPTLEQVAFFDRKTYKPLKLRSIPPILFSETMRDIDLAVSIAHVGGIDPQASLTTIDMRKAIIRESLRLTKTANVRLDKNFAFIEGNLGEYGVHLGSGSVQKLATGSLYIIPVHSQHRGKLFLPFLDEDPKTAEILAKVLLLANDKTIKDPHILEQLKN